MRRIIPTLAVIALTGCGAPGPDSDTAAHDSAAHGAAANDAAANDAATNDGAVGDAASRAADGARAVSGHASDAPVVLFVGTSLTAGYGVGQDSAYPAVLQQLIDSAGLSYRVVNAGVSGETSAGGLRRIDWALQQPAAVLVLELGANDALRGLDPALTHANLDAILTRARELRPDIAFVIVGMEAPPNLGDDYARQFRHTFTDLAAKHRAALVPFLLDGVAGDPSLNLDDRIHPDVAGHRIIARTVWGVLEPVLRSPR